MNTHLSRCPVCGFALDFEPWTDDLPSEEICPCCLVQFGYQDFGGGTLAGRAQRHLELRQGWILQGMPWLGDAARKPTKWDPRDQLAAVLGQGG